MSETVTLRWLPMSEQPEQLHRPHRQFIRVEGWKEHHGGTWHRSFKGIAYTRHFDDPNGFKGYRREDIDQMMIDGDMDGIDEITHWMPARFPVVTGRREP